MTSFRVTIGPCSETVAITLSSFSFPCPNILAAVRCLTSFSFILRTYRVLPTPGFLEDTNLTLKLKEKHFPTIKVYNYTLLHVKLKTYTSKSIIDRKFYIFTKSQKLTFHHQF